MTFNTPQYRFYSVLADTLVKREGEREPGERKENEEGERKEKRQGREKRRQEKKKDVVPSEIIRVKQGHCVVRRSRVPQSGSTAGPAVFQGAKENGSWLEMKMCNIT